MSAAGSSLGEVSRPRAPVELEAQMQREQINCLGQTICQARSTSVTSWNGGRRQVATRISHQVWGMLVAKL
eukprot:1237952-Alexandrium_andersonii.AAC.1